MWRDIAGFPGLHYGVCSRIPREQPGGQNFKPALRKKLDFTLNLSSLNGMGDWQTGTVNTEQ